MLKINNKLKIAIMAFAIISIVIGGILGFNKSFGMQHYEKLDFVTGIVTATTLNVRQGPSTSYNIVTQIHKNEYIRVFAKIGNWYVIQTDKDYIGAVNTNYVRPIYPSKENTNSQNANSNNTLQGKTTQLTNDEKETLNLINEQRTSVGLQPLQIDDELQNVARIKAQDMVDNNYFSHTSPTYGSPFDMIKKFGITYKTAGENIAGNSTNSGAVNAWMNSSGHKANILNNSYNYTGLAVVTSPKYGKIYVQMFMGK